MREEDEENEGGKRRRGEGTEGEVCERSKKEEGG